MSATSICALTNSFSASCSNKGKALPYCLCSLKTKAFCKSRYVPALVKRGKVQTTVKTTTFNESFMIYLPNNCYSSVAAVNHIIKSASIQFLRLANFYKPVFKSLDSELSTRSDMKMLLYIHLLIVH